MSLPAEISIAGVYVPGLLVLAVLLLIAAWAVDTLAGRSGLYRHAWHPPLFRLALYVGAFAGAGLLLLP
jgi:hypothetical protein